jgi:hypothetical protein
MNWNVLAAIAHLAAVVYVMPSLIYLAVQNPGYEPVSR